MNDRVGQAIEPYKKLAEINRAISTSLNFDEVLDLIVASAAELFGARITALLILDNDGLLRVRSSKGLDPQYASRFTGRMEEHLIKQLRDSLVSENEVLVTVPIIARQSLSGLLLIIREQALTDEQEWQLSALADQAGIALRNARLHELELAELTRKRDETNEALKAANEKVTAILESITDLFYSLDREWRFTDINRQTELRFGKPRQELIGKVIWDVYPLARETPLYPNLKRTLDDGVAVNFELESAIVPGVWFEAHAYPTSDGLSAYLRDISERKRAEITSHLLASIVESSDDAIVSKDLNGVISSWNKGAERIFGYTAAEAVGKSIIMLLPPDRLQEEVNILTQIRKGLRVDHYETIRVRKDGTLIDVALTISPVKDAKGNLVGASKIARDITNYKQQERAVRFQADLLGAVEQAVIATDLEGQILYWNHFAEKLYGWTASEAIGANVIDIIPAPEMRTVANEIFESIQRGASWSGEFQVRRKDGSLFPSMVTDSPIFDSNGVLIGVVGVSVDISERKRAEADRALLLERERIARTEAEEANRLKDEFLATLSHELRNPLNVILGYSEVLIRSDEAKRSPFIRRAAEILKRNAQAQSQLVRDLLDLSRLHAGKISINPEVVSLTTMIRNAVETVRDEASQKNLHILIKTPDDAVFIKADPLRMEQVIWNLLNNAVKFTPAGGTVTASLRTEGSDAVLAIQDTGEGIDPAFLPHVFEMFRQGNAKNNRKHGGLGIGLALVQRLAELQHGSVSATSAGSGKGATFTLRLPMVEKPQEQSSDQPNSEAGVLNHMRILVVDDSLDTVDMLRRLFEMDGATVNTARGGTEALEMVGKQQFDVILSDISMPDMDGFELLRRLRKLPQGSDIPVLALTGFGRNEDVERTKAEGFYSHITKPIDISGLVDLLQNLPARAS